MQSRRRRHPMWCQIRTEALEGNLYMLHNDSRDEGLISSRGFVHCKTGECLAKYLVQDSLYQADDNENVTEPDFKMKQ